MSSGPPTRVFLGLGSNLGDRLGHLQLAVDGLASTTGVANATVTLEPGQAKVEYDEAAATPQQLMAAVTTAGYSASIAR